MEQLFRIAGELFYCISFATAMPKQFTLRKDERLKSRKQTELLFSTGKKFSLHPFRIFYIVQEQGIPGIRFGVGVSTKLFKRAVDRNRVKRLIRECWRLQKLTLKEQVEQRKTGLDIFFIYTGKELPVYNELYQKMGAVINKMTQLTTQAI
jgi:ribonuclease P protein component